MHKRLSSFLFPLLLLCSHAFASDDSQQPTFDEFLRNHNKAVGVQEKDSLLNRFWSDAKQQGIPYVASNKTDVVFLYRGVDSVRLIGDFTSWTFRIPMKRLPGSDLWYLKLTFEPDARLDYKFDVGSRGLILDPNNGRLAPTGYGENSELAMPEYISAPELKEGRKIDKGTMTTLSVASKILGYDHTVLVYLPAGYESGTERYPTAYFQDGSEYTDFGRAQTILDNLIAANDITPIIGVFVVPPVGEKRNRMTEYGMSKSYERFFTTELIPFIDKKYRTEPKAQSRLVVGASFGGLISLTIAFNNPELIANVASQSGFVSFRNDTLINLFGQAGPKPLRIYFSIGTYEKNIGRTLLKHRESDFLAGNRRLNKTLEQRQYQIRYREFRDGHSWARWRTDLPNIFRWFFPTGEPN